MNISLSITSGPHISDATLEAFAAVAEKKGKSPTEFLAETITRAAKPSRKPSRRKVVAK